MYSFLKIEFNSSDDFGVEIVWVSNKFEFEQYCIY